MVSAYPTKKISELKVAHPVGYPVALPKIIAEVEEGNLSRIPVVQRKDGIYAIDCEMELLAAKDLELEEVENEENEIVETVLSDAEIEVFEKKM